MKETITNSCQGVLCVLHLYITVLHRQCLNMQKNKIKFEKNNINKNMYRWASKRVIKTLIYYIKRLILHWFQTMNADKETKKKCMKIYHKSRHCSLQYVQSFYSFFFTASTIYNLKHCRRVCLEKLKRDSKINKAEHGYKTGMHAVSKHPVNNMLRLNEVFM